MEKNSFSLFNKQKLKIFSLAFFIFFFTACEDKTYFTKVYDSTLYKKSITCLQLEITPFNQDIYNTTQKLYDFNFECNTKLQIRYKTNIGCNSPYAKDKSFKSFIELNLIKNNVTYYTIYKDLKNEDIQEEIKKGFFYLKEQIDIK